jgi:hypothetical protein
MSFSHTRDVTYTDSLSFFACHLQSESQNIIKAREHVARTAKQETEWNQRNKQGAAFLAVPRPSGAASPVQPCIKIVTHCSRIYVYSMVFVRFVLGSVLYLSGAPYDTGMGPRSGRVRLVAVLT